MNLARQHLELTSVVAALPPMVGDGGGGSDQTLPSHRSAEAHVADHLDFTSAYPDLFVLAERAAMKILHDRTAAEDVAADTMARALASWGKVRGYARPWVTRVAVNRAIDLTRRRGRPTGHDDSAEVERRISTQGAPDTMAVDRLDLVAALGKLSSRQREAVALRYLVGLDDAGAAAVLGCGTETVRSHVRRALKSLRLELSDSEELHHAAR